MWIAQSSPEREPRLPLAHACAGPAARGATVPPNTLPAIPLAPAPHRTAYAPSQCALRDRSAPYSIEPLPLPPTHLPPPLMEPRPRRPQPPRRRALAAPQPDDGSGATRARDDVFCVRGELSRKPFLPSFFPSFFPAARRALSSEPDGSLGSEPDEPFLSPPFHSIASAARSHCRGEGGREDGEVQGCREMRRWRVGGVGSGVRGGWGAWSWEEPGGEACRVQSARSGTSL